MFEDDLLLFDDKFGDKKETILYLPLLDFKFLKAISQQHSQHPEPHHHLLNLLL